MPNVVAADREYRTLGQRVQGNPFDPSNYGEIVKPGELVDIVELSPHPCRSPHLQPADCKRLGAYRRADHPSRVSNQRSRARTPATTGLKAPCCASGTVAIVTIRKGGKVFKRRVQLLGPSDESLKDGFLHYRIPEEASRDTAEQ